MSTVGPQWQIPPIGNDSVGSESIDQVGGAGAGKFDSMLGQQIQKLADMQTEAADASTKLATGQATDPAETIMAVERARLSMQLASTLRTKGVEAVSSIFQTQV